MPPPQPPHKPPYSAVQNLPDFLITAVSILLFISSPKPHHHHHHHHNHNHNHLSLFPHRRTSTTMSQNPRNPRNPRNPNFSSPQSLSNWLKPRLPSDSLSTWGISPGTKNVYNLFLELVAGETSLIDSVPPVRNLEVVCIRVRRGNFCLIEDRQELSDGSFRNRCRPLSEKMKSGEGVESCAKRAIKEELGSVLGGGGGDENVRIVFDCYERKVEEKVSLSYPGLPACYVLHYVDAFVDGLPEGEFVTEEEGDEYDGGDDHGVANEAAVKCKRHFWKWVDDESV